MCEIELRQKREALYQRFDNVSSPLELFSLQRSIAEDIIDCEKNIIKNNKGNHVWKEHLQKLLSIGDSIVWQVLEPFTIRQLGKYESNITSLASQEDVIVEILNRFQEKSEKTIFLIADITRCITVGDIIEVITSDQVRIIECKSSKPEVITANNILRGRLGRQFSKAFWLQNYMEIGFGQLYSHDRPTRTIEIETSKNYHIDLIPNLIDECMKNENGTSYVQAESGLLYIAQRTDSELKDETIASLPKLKKPVVASTARLIEEPKETIFHAPPLILNIPLEYRIMLQEVDINIITILDLSCVEEICTQLGFEYSETEQGLPQMSKNGKSHIFHIRFINEILINFITVKDAVETMTTLFDRLEEQGGNLTPEEKKQMENRPQSREDFVKYLGDNYVIATTGGEGKIIKAYTMQGTIIYNLNCEE